MSTATFKKTAQIIDFSKDFILKIFKDFKDFYLHKSHYIERFPESSNGSYFKKKVLRRSLF